MKVTINTWYGPKETELAVVLQPEAAANNRGAIEDAQAQADACAQAIGNLAALLVDHKLITLDQAAEACGIYNIITPIED